MGLPSDKPDSTSGHLLVAEDDLVVQLVVKKLLTEAGYTLDIVDDGVELLSALGSRHYDLILVDCLMPRMDGFEATRAIRKSNSPEINGKIPVIAMTGLTDEEDQVRCLDAGMDGIVNKPLDSQSLLGVIQQFLGDARSDRAGPGCEEEPEKQFWEEDFFESVIDEFLAEVPRVINDLQEAFDQGDTAMLRHVSHRLRGATDILNASRLSSLSKSLEKMAKDGDIEASGQLVSQVIEELQRLIALISE